MTLNGGKLILLGKNGQEDKILETKEKNFRIGYYMSCDFIHEHPDVEGIHCEIVCDPFGRISIRNFSVENPISVNSSIVKGLRPLLSGNIIEVLGKQFRWMHGMGSSLETPVRKESKAEQPPKSEPSSKEQKLIQRRLTVHSFAYGLQTQFEDTVEVPNVEYPENRNIENKSEKMEYADIFEQSIKVRKSVSSTDDIKTTPQHIYTSENLQNTLNFSKNSEIDMENGTPQIKLSLCYQSEIVVTSYSPCTPSSRSVQSFAYITSINTPRSLYSTPKGALSEFNASGDDRGDMIDFKTPGTVRCGKSSMHLIDLTTPLKLKTPKRVQSSSLVKPALKNSAKTATKSVTRQHSVSIQRNSKLKINKSTPVATGRNLSMSLTPKRKFCEERSETFKNKTLPAVTVSESNKGQFFLDNTEAANNFPQITLDSTSASTVNIDSTGITDGSVIEISTDEISNLSLEHRKTPVSIKSTANKLMRKAIMTSARKIITNPDVYSSKVNSKLNQSAKISFNKGAPLRKGGSSSVLNLSSQTIDRTNNLASISLNLGGSTPKRLTFTNSLSTSTPLKIRKSTSVTPLKIRNKGEFSGNYKSHSCIDLNQTGKKLSGTLRKTCANTDRKNLKSVNKSIPFTKKLISSTDALIQTVQSLNSTFIVESDRNFSEEHRNIKEKHEIVASADNSKIYCQEETNNIRNIFDENNETTETNRKCETEDNVANKKVVQFESEDKTEEYRQKALKIQENQVTDVNKPSNLPVVNLSNLKGIKEFHTTKENSAPLLLHSSKIDGKVVDNNSIGIKDLLKTPSSLKNSTADLRRSKELKKSSKTTLTLTDNFVGIKELMKTPKKFDNIEDNLLGLKELVKTPRAFKSDDVLVGKDYIFMTPSKDEITDEQKIGMSDFKNNVSPTQSSQMCNFNKEIEDESTFKTPSAKMAMVLGTPECINVNIESNSEGLMGPIIYDFRENMEELEDIFQTPGVPELSEVMEERFNEYETLTAEECFGNLTERPCVKRSYSRKSKSPKKACALVQSTVKRGNDLPMTDVQEWVEKINHSLDSKDNFLKEAKENDKNISKDEMLNDNDELATGDVSGINLLESTNGSVFSCSLVYSDDELSGFDNFSSVPSLNRKRSKSCTSKTSLNNADKRSPIRQQELRKYRQSVGSKPFNQENGKENKITVEYQCESHENSSKIKYLNIPFYQEMENKNDMSKENYVSELYLGADENSELDTACENITNKPVRKNEKGKYICEIKHKHVAKVHRKPLGDNTHNASLHVGGEREGLEVVGEKEELEVDCEKEGLEVEDEKVRIEVDDVLKNVNESALRCMNRRSVINQTVYKDALISPKGRTIGNETFYMSFDLEAERERYEMEKDFEDFYNISPKKRSRGKSVCAFNSKNIFIKSRKSTGDETKDIPFYTEIEKGRIEIEEAFKNFSERPTNRGTRNKSVCESTLKSALKKVRKTMHNSKQDISFDIEIEKERIEIEKAFENFDEKSTNRRLRSKSINVSAGRRELKKARNTMGDALEDVVSFDIESEKERFEREQDFVHFDKSPTVRSIRGRSVVEIIESKESVYKDNLARNRKTMGNLSNDVSFDIETEKQRIEREEDFTYFEKNTIVRNTRGRSVMESNDKNALSQNRKTMGSLVNNVSFDIETEKKRIERAEDFAHFENNPVIRCTRGRSVLEFNESTDKDSLTQNRKTMGDLSNEVTFDVETEKERVNREKEFENFDQKSTNRGKKGRSVNTFTSKKTSMKHRKTMGYDCQNVSFELDIEKERLELEKDFAHFNKNSTVRSIRGRSTVETRESNEYMCEDNLAQNRKTMGNLANDVSFDVESEKQRIEREEDFAHFEKNTIARNTRGRSVMESMDKNTLARNRKTMGNLVNDVSFDIETEKKRIEKEEDFAHFEKNPVIRNTRGRSVLEYISSTDKDTLTRKRKTMDDLPNEVTFDVETEKERVDREKEFENFDKKSTNRSKKGRSVHIFTSKKTSMIPRKTLGYDCQNVSFELDIEKERLELEKDFAHFEKNPTVRSIRGRSTVETRESNEYMCEDNLAQNRKTMGNLANDVSFDVESEKQRIETEEDFAHFEKNTIARNTRGRSVMESMDKNTLARNRKTMGNLVNDVSFDIETEKKRIEKEEDFAHFEKNPVIRNTRGKSVLEYIASMDKDTLTRKRKTTGALPNDTAFDVETEKEKVDREKEFEHFDQKRTNRGIKGSLNTSDKTNQSENKFNLKSSTPTTPRKTLGHGHAPQDASFDTTKQEKVEMENAFGNITPKNTASNVLQNVLKDDVKKTDELNGKGFESYDQDQESSFDNDYSFLDSNVRTKQCEILSSANIQKSLCKNEILRNQNVEIKTPLNKISDEKLKYAKSAEKDGESTRETEVPCTRSKKVSDNQFDKFESVSKEEEIKNHSENELINAKKTLQQGKKIVIRKEKENINGDDKEKCDYFVLKKESSNTPNNLVLMLETVKSKSNRKRKIELDKERPISKDDVSATLKTEPVENSDLHMLDARKEVKSLELIGKLSGRGRKVKAAEKNYEEIAVANGPDRKVETSTRRGRKKKNEIEEEMPVQKAMNAGSEIDMNEPDRKVETSTRRGRKQKNEIEEEMSVQKEMTASSEIDMNIYESDRKVEFVHKETSTRRGRKKKNEIEEEMTASSEIGMNEPDKKVEPSTRRGRKKKNEVEEKMPVQKEITASSEIDMNIYEPDKKVEFVHKEPSTRGGRKKKNEIEEEMTASSEIDMNEPDRKVETSTRRGRKKKNEIEEEMPLQKEMTATSEIDMNIYESDRKVEFVHKETSTRRGRKKKNEIEEEMTASSEIDMNEPDRKVETSTRRGRKMKNEIDEEMPVHKEMTASSEIGMNEPDKKVEPSTRRGRKKKTEVEEKMPVQKEITASSEIDMNIYEPDKKVEFVHKETSTRGGRNKKFEIEEEMRVQKEITASSEIDMVHCEVETSQKKSQSNRIRRQPKVNRVTKRMHEDARNTLEIPLSNVQALEDKEEQIKLEVKRATRQKISMKEVASVEFPAIQSLRPRRGNQEKTAVCQAKTEAVNEEIIDKESPTNIRVTRKRRRNKNELTTNCETIEKEILINSKLLSMSETESQVLPKMRRVRKLGTMENIDHTNLSAQIFDKNNAKKDAIPSRSKNICKAKNILEKRTDELTSVKIISKTLLERNKNSTPSTEHNNIVEFKTPINVVPRARRCLRSNSTHTSTPVLSEEQFLLKDDLLEINEKNKNEKNKSKTGIAKGRRILAQEIDTDDESSKGIAGRKRTWRKKEVDTELSKKKPKLEAKSSGFQTEENESNSEMKPKKTPTKTNKNKENKSNQSEVLMNSEKMAPTISTLGKRKIVQTNGSTETEEVTTIRTTRPRKK